MAVDDLDFATHVRAFAAACMKSGHRLLAVDFESFHPPLPWRDRPSGGMSVQAGDVLVHVTWRASKEQLEKLAEQMRAAGVTLP